MNKHAHKSGHKKVANHGQFTAELVTMHTRLSFKRSVLYKYETNISLNTHLCYSKYSTCHINASNLSYTHSYWKLIASMFRHFCESLSIFPGFFFLRLLINDFFYKYRNLVFKLNKCRYKVNLKTSQNQNFKINPRYRITAYYIGISKHK